MKNAGMIALTGLGLCLAVLLAVPAVAQMASQHSHTQMHQTHQHDMARMPGLQGRDTTTDEVGDMAAMFRQFPSLSRQVTLVDLHFKLGLGQFLEKRYTSIETFAA